MPFDSFKVTFQIGVEQQIESWK